MKKTLIMLTSALVASTVLTANASYTAIYGEKQINGDNITFVDKGIWNKTTPTISSWFNVGEATGCSEWAPAIDTIVKDLVF